MNDADIDYWTVLDGALEADQMAVVQGDGYTVAELLPGVYEMVVEGETPRLNALEDVFDWLDDAEILQPGKYMFTEWKEVEDGRMSCTLLRA